MLRGRDAAGYRRAHTANHGGRHVDALVAGALPGLRRTLPTAIKTVDAYSHTSLVHGRYSVVFLIKNTSIIHPTTVPNLGSRHRPQHGKYAERVLTKASPCSRDHSENSCYIVGRIKGVSHGVVEPAQKSRLGSQDPYSRE
jgi:hypothetical protein